jgi:alcohol dehydrogenase class IV
MGEFNFYMPTKVNFGWGRISEIGDVVKSLGGSKVFLVTGKSSAKKSGALDKIEQVLKGMGVVLFDRVEENPTIATVDNGAQACKEAGCDVVIGVGGGSPLDAAKAMAMLQKNQGSIREYLDGERTCGYKGLPFISVTTTSGTGSEVTPFAVITHPEKRAKPAIAPPQMFPDVAIVDPELTMTMSPEVTASTGLDALVQAFEGFWSIRANAVTRSLAFQGIVLALRNLEAARDKEKQAVINLAKASNLTGIEMSQIGNTAIHPLSYPFTMDHHVPHGFACAVFLPSFIRFNADVTRDLFADLLAVMGLGSVEDLADHVDALMDRLGAPKRLSEWGVNRDRLQEMTTRGVGGSTAWNPKPPTHEDLLSICQNLM